MLADDQLGAQRESPNDLSPYRRALADISADPRLFQVIAERDGEVVGTMQLSITPGLSRKGMSRMNIEGVRVSSNARGGGIGHQMIEWAIDHARDSGCGLVELTTDKSRGDAHRFYENLGFERSHFGYKFKLD
jgi:GNAT superfamily N-acetyltransferase